MIRKCEHFAEKIVEIFGVAVALASTSVGSLSTLSVSKQTRLRY
jgi:hypothetical protein